MSAQPESIVQPNKHTQAAPQTPPRHPARGCARQVRNLCRPRALQLPICMRPAKRALAAATAPACLQRDLQQKNKPARQLVLACAWAEKAVAQPHLLPGPLLGTCLEDVLQAPTRAQGDERIHAAKHVELPPPPKSLPFPQPRTAGLPHPTQSMHPMLQPLGHPARAGIELLARRAGGYQVVSRLSARAKPARRPAQRVASNARRLDSTLVPGPGLSPDWLARLEGHLVRRFQRVSRSLGQMISVAPSLPPYTLENMASWVSHALALNLAGPGASLEFLQRLVDAAETLPENRSARHRSPDSVSETTSPELLRSPAERSASGVPPWDAPFSDTPRGEAPSPVLQPPTGAQQGFYPQMGTLPLPAAGQPNYRPLVAPPLAAETLPTLITPQVPFDAPTPYVSAAARQAVRQDEERLAEEDLDLLAAKIKRILSDEASRHGIRV